MEGCCGHRIQNVQMTGGETELEYSGNCKSVTCDRIMVGGSEWRVGAHSYQVSITA